MTDAVVFEYSQTGQLTEVTEALIAPLERAGWRIRRVLVEPVEPYPFPWPIRRFFGVFPTCVDEHATIDISVADGELRSEPGELVILAYQVWYLAPALPARALLRGHPELFADRDVLTVVACRNMWYSAAAEVGRHLAAAGARPRGAVAAIDTRAQALTLVTTLRWLLTGRRDGAWFGRAGVGADELERVGRIGSAIAAARSAAEVSTAELTDPAAPVVPVLAAADLVAGRIFRYWGGAVRRASAVGAAGRAVTLVGFVGWLGAAILVGLPALAAARLVGRDRFDRSVRARVGRMLEVPATSGVRS
ncbi:hypothetical protein [Nocardia wallacei]|uniref:hypothetical protein n=1 Tax=Nocardia wallacei TaxID=480035 RepID=UPI002455684F|nr:hypothetical protein [Nocardia wallacei]